MLLQAAQKSPPDHTGRVRCLSCGSVFAHHEALASHLTKHGGLNALDYTPAKVVATSNRIYKHMPIERPVLLLHDAIVDATRRPKQTEKHKPRDKDTLTQKRGISEYFVQERSLSAVDVKGKNHKATPTKRSILIHQVLSLNQKLATYRRQLDVLKTKTDPTFIDVETKKQMKRIQGCMNATETELHMALIAVNRKLTFRQLVMIEYLTCQLEEWIASSDRTPDPPLVDDVIAMETINENDLHLYDEADVLLNKMEAVREGMESEISSRLICTRTDPESGKMFIIKPSFFENCRSSTESAEVIEHPMQTVMDETVMAIPEEAWMDDRHDKDDDDDAQTVGGISSDDDMWGFSNVLVEWANAAKHKNQQTFPSVLPVGYTPFECKSKKELVTGDGPTDMAVEETAVHVVHTSKKAINVQHAPAHVQSPNNGESGWAEELQEVVDRIERTGRCVFIKPHLGNLDEEKEPSVLSWISRNRGNKRDKTSLGNGSINGRASLPIRQDNEPTAIPMADPKTLDDAVHALLSQLNSKQHEHMKTNKSRHRWMVTGLSEVSKHLARGSVKLLIIAQHLDLSIQSKISEIEALANGNNVPVVFALTRKKIGQIYHPRKRMGIVAVLDIQDLEEAFSVVIRMKHSQS